VFFASVLLMPCAPAEELSIPLSALAARVRSSHPALRAARLELEEAKGRQLGAGRPANPVAGLEYQSESELSPSALTFSIDQTFPLTNKLRLEKSLSVQQVRAAGLEIQDAERRLVLEAETHAVQLLILDRKRALGAQQMELANRLARFAEEKVSSGEVSALDATQARVYAQQIRFETRKWDTERIGLLGSLQPMLGLSPHDHLTVTGDLPPINLPSAPSDGQHRPDLLLAQSRAEAAETESELASKNQWPEVTAGIFTAQEAQDVGTNRREHTSFNGIRLSVPLPLWNQNQGEIAEKAAAAERARLQREALRQTVAVEAETARKEMLAQAQLLRDTQETLMPLLATQSKDLAKSYESGQTNQLTLIEAAEQRLKLEVSALEVERDFHLARLRYEAATAQPSSP
jgi:cobalt-zinc-cadmium efflux system outer membrane protein